CTDKVSCSEYEEGMCTSPSYKAWAASNCAAFCNMCGDRRKRSVSNLMATLENLEPSLRIRNRPPFVSQVEPRLVSPAQIATLVETRHPEPRQLSPAKGPMLVTEESKEMLDIHPEEPHENDFVPTPVRVGVDVVPTPVRDETDLVPTPVKNGTDIEPKPQEDMVNEQQSKELFPGLVPVTVSQVPLETKERVPGKDSHMSDLPNIEEGQAPLAVPAPKVDLDQLPPQQNNFEVGLFESTEVTGHQEVGSKYEGKGVTVAIQELESEGRDGKLLVQELDALKEI
ncbi:uncharacterized protein LOC110444295, partial [Mizuhopecten yessoensis]